MDPTQAAEIEAALPALLDRFYARVRQTPSWVRCSTTRSRTGTIT